MNITPNGAVETIRKKFTKQDGRAMIPLLGVHPPFEARLIEGGITVSNLNGQDFLAWPVFQEAIKVLIRNGGRAQKGNAMAAHLGEPELSLDSVEGHIARTVYGKNRGD